jgi:uncharacterized small protein (DUF1192 family)
LPDHRRRHKPIREVRGPCEEEERMDWEDVRPKPQREITVGAKLEELSIEDLQARIAALEGEIVRVRAELDAKRTRQRAADELFKR